MGGNEMKYIHKHEFKHNFDKGGNQWGLTIVYCYDECRYEK